MSGRPPTRDDRQVLVVGAGVGGLSLAAFLRRRGYDPTVVARADDRRRVDDGLVLWSNGVALLAELGLAEFVTTLPEVTHWRVETTAGPTVGRFERAHRDGPPFLAVGAERLRSLLRRDIPADRLRLSKSPRDIERTVVGPIVEFADGVHERFDVVVGADGTDSWVRAAGLDADPEVTYRSRVWTFRTDPETDRRDRVTELWGPDGSRLRVVPLASADAARFAVPESDREREFSTAVATHLAGADHPDTPGRLPDDADPECRTVAHRRWPDRWVGRRIGLLGDAAHPLPSAVSIGPAIAIEDAYVLADEIDRRATVRTALRRYEHRRRERLCDFGRVFDGCGAPGLDVASPWEARWRSLGLLRDCFASRSGLLSTAIPDGL